MQTHSDEPCDVVMWMHGGLHSPRAFPFHKQPF